MAKTVTIKKVEPPTSAKPVAAAKPAPVAKKDPTHEEISRRAYEIYLRRGGKPGNPQDDWHQAVRELKEGK